MDTIIYSGKLKDVEQKIASPKRKNRSCRNRSGENPGDENPGNERWVQAAPRAAAVAESAAAVAGPRDRFEEMLALIQQQQAAITRIQEAAQAKEDRLQAKEDRLQGERDQAKAERDQAKAANDQMLEEINEVQEDGGIYGYNQGTPLTEEEREFHDLLQGFGINEQTADELFRQGMSGIGQIKRMTDYKLKNTLVRVSKSKSTKCPDPSKVFLGAVFEEQLGTLIAWAKFQPKIGVRPTAFAWNSNPTAASQTYDRLQYYEEIKDSDGTEDISLPPPLKDMKHFRDFEDNLTSYLRIKRGAAKIPLSYVIRENEAVTADDRDGLVGPNEAYEDWDDYGIQCVVMKGTYWANDNASVWQILQKLVKDGPGWDFIRQYEKRGKIKGNGDGRKAYKALFAQAYQYSSVRTLTIETRKKLLGLRFAGPSRNWTYDKYVREWIRGVDLLKKHDFHIREDIMVSDFCGGISDPRLKVGVSTVLVEGSEFCDNFDKTQKFFANLLAVDKSQSDTNKDRGRNVSYTESSKGGNNGNGERKSTYTGPIEARNYEKKIWWSMSKKQRDAVIKLRNAKKSNDGASSGNKRNASAIATEDDTAITPAEQTAGNQFGSAAHQGKKVRWQKK